MSNLDIQAAHPVDAAIEVKKAECLALRIRGKSYRKIQELTGVSKSRAHAYVTEALDEIRSQNGESAEQLRRLELERLDKWQDQLEADDAAGTDPRTIDTLLRISERRAKLVGLDAPSRWEGSGPGGGPIPLASIGYDLTRLPSEELEQLERILIVALTHPEPAALEAPKP